MKRVSNVLGNLSGGMSQLLPNRGKACIYTVIVLGVSTFDVLRTLL